MLYIGVDAHKKRCFLTAKEKDGRLVARRPFLHTKEGWRKALGDAPKGSRVAVECVGWYQPVFALLEDLGLEPVLVHAKKVAMIAKSTKKTDRNDSEVLCDLLRTGFLPTAHAPSKTSRELREITRLMEDVTKEMIRVKNRVHAVLGRAWVEEPGDADLFGQHGREFLMTVGVSRAHRVVLDVLVEELEALERLHARLAREATVLATDADDDVELLMSVTGIGTLGAVMLKAEIDTVERFPNRGAFRSYFGMAVSVRDSADTRHRGHITKQGPGVVRKVVVQGALHFVKDNPGSKVKYDRLCQARGKGIARVAAGGDVLDVVYQLLKTRTRYRYERTQRVALKRAELKRLAARPQDSCVS